MSYTYLGATSRKFYRFRTPITDSHGNIIEQAVFNGETVVLCNDDGSVRRGTAGPPSAADIYAPTWSPSPWEKL